MVLQSLNPWEIIHDILAYFITYFGQARNYVGQVKFINYLPGMDSSSETYVGAWIAKQKINKANKPNQKLNKLTLMESLFTGWYVPSKVKDFQILINPFVILIIDFLVFINQFQLSVNDFF